MYNNKLNSLNPPHKGLHVGTRTLLFAAALVLILQVLLYLLGGQNNVCVHFWLYPFLFILEIALLVALIIPGARRIAKTAMAKKLLTALACMITGFVALVGWSVVWAFYSIGNQPIAYHTSPSGEHRLVIMRHYDMGESIEDSVRIYEAFPMVNALYYEYQENGSFSELDIASSADAGGSSGSAEVQSSQQDIALAVEWLDDAHARVYLPDVADGKEILVDFIP